MIVDGDRAASTVGLHRMARHMNFADQPRVEGIEPGLGVAAKIMGGNKNVVDVEQQAAAGPAAQFVQEIGLAPVACRKGKIARRIFDQDRAAETVLHARHFARKMRKRRAGIGDRQQVGKFIAGTVAPAQMVRHHRRRVACAERRQRIEFAVIDGARRPQRQTDRMKAQRHMVGDRGQPAMRGSARAEIILGVDFGPGGCRARLHRGKKRGIMLRFQSYAGASG